ncbi:HipA domain-containing protein [Paraburkholderia silviterrae]|uniref:HipA domain-containing protein n=1 Tax=Paraburkholderia silviterrae TaxID=2528715 RepID=A0A4R5M2S7_9BURK|nr:HipA domain-containing protein [Paraburkholderia silviterrae]
MRLRGTAGLKSRRPRSPTTARCSPCADSIGVRLARCSRSKTSERLKALIRSASTRARLRESRSLRSPTSRARFKENARRLFTLLLVNYAMHNADGHLKNFALAYTDMNDARLAPVYNVLTPSVYPSFADAAPALDLQSTRVWASGKLLTTNGGARLGLSKADTNECVEQVMHAVHTVTPLVPIPMTRSERRKPIPAPTLTAHSDSVPGRKGAREFHQSASLSARPRRSPRGRSKTCDQLRAGACIQSGQMVGQHAQLDTSRRRDAEPGTRRRCSYDVDRR